MNGTKTLPNISEYRKSEYEVDPLFLNRWSPRAYDSRDVTDDVLFKVLEAAKWAPSAANFQPWKFILARSGEDREKFYSFIFDGNRIWCEKAPVLLVLASEKTRGEGKENPAHAFDAGTAWGYLALQASKEGLVTHAMGGFDKEEAREVLGLPDEYEAQVVISLGYQGNIEDLPEALKEREIPSSRKSLDEIVDEGAFDQPIKK